MTMVQAEFIGSSLMKIRIANRYRRISGTARSAEHRKVFNPDQDAI